MLFILLLEFKFLVALLTTLSACGVVFTRPPGIPPSMITNSSEQWSAYLDGILGDDMHHARFVNLSAESGVIDPANKKNPDPWFLVNTEKFQNIVRSLP
jgi:hypothetical protein